MAFNTATRRMIVQLPTVAKPSGGGTVNITIPKVGLLARIYLRIAGTISGTLTNNNPLGKAAIVSAVRLTANNGIDIFQTSGPGYHYLLRPMLESEYVDIAGGTDALSAVATGNFDVSMVIPVALNMRDPVGLIMLQSEQTVVNLSITFEADGSVATGATVTASVQPYVEYFTVPANPEDMPALNVIHQILEDRQSVPAPGEYTYNWPRGNTYLQIAHGLGMGVSGADAFSRVSIRVNQSSYLQATDTAFLDMEHWFVRGKARRAGTVLVDLLGTSGLGNYGLTRDVFNSANVTDLATVIQATASGTLYTVRRQLVVLG